MVHPAGASDSVADDDGGGVDRQWPEEPQRKPNEQHPPPREDAHWNMEVEAQVRGQHCCAVVVVGDGPVVMVVATAHSK